MVYTKATRAATIITAIVAAIIAAIIAATTPALIAATKAPPTTKAANSRTARRLAIVLVVPT